MDKTYFNREKPDIIGFDRRIFVNQAGYRPEQKKKAVITVPAEMFRVIDESGKVHFEGKTVNFGLDENSGDNVRTADFSALTEEGRYIIETDSGERSLYFDIGADCYDKVFYDVSKAFYYLRCGCGLDEKHAGKFAHGKCHCGTALLWDDRKAELEVSGGWHDAGDYGRYVTAGACALAHLLYAYRMFPDSFAVCLDIPESGSGVPDILSECRYELEWLLKMQRADGGVYHKATTAMHAPFIMPEDDREQMFVFGVSSMATADLAAVCAMASGIYRKYDSAFADRLIEAAELSYGWLEANPDFLGFENPEGCNTGGYGEHDDCDNRFWAAAEMYCATGGMRYFDDMKGRAESGFPLAALGYGSVGGFGALSCLLSGRELFGLESKFRSAFYDEAKRLADIADKCGYAAAMRTEDYCWGSNMNLLKHGMIFVIADYLSGECSYRDYAAAQLDYLLGVNATGYSYVTGNGGFAYNYPHLRPAFADGIEECIPGMVSGGPNRFPCDHDAKILIPEGTPPMKCFADDVGCYSLNEITIYWNSPAVFLIAAL